MEHPQLLDASPPVHPIFKGEYYGVTSILPHPYFIQVPVRCCIVSPDHA